MIGLWEENGSSVISCFFASIDVAILEQLYIIGI